MTPKADIRPKATLRLQSARQLQISSRRDGSQTLEAPRRGNSMIDRQIVSPIPVPVGFVVKNGSKIRPLSFSPIPAPESAMETTIWFEVLNDI